MQRKRSKNTKNYEIIILDKKNAIWKLLKFLKRKKIPIKHIKILNWYNKWKKDINLNFYTL